MSEMTQEERDAALHQIFDFVPCVKLPRLTPEEIEEMTRYFFFVENINWHKPVQLYFI